MAKKKTPPGYYDPSEYVLVHEKHCERIKRLAGDFNSADEALAQRIAAHLGRADAWPDVLSLLHGEPVESPQADPAVVTQG
jgi:hypothetical protein